ncbi:MAG: hypothetical protein HKN16_10030 [Saprospiraceae bacterium]|nr:hypothetical protein [Saprospiraceae bacterium]
MSKKNLSTKQKTSGIDMGGDTMTADRERNFVGENLIENPDLKKMKASKKFGSHLESLFLENEDPAIDILDAPKDSSDSENIPSGLNALIRKTLAVFPENISDPTEMKRVTFLYSRNQLEKVRFVSKAELIYMKDIIGEAVDQWLKKYEKRKVRALERRRARNK